MIDRDYTFGTARMYCDSLKCSHDILIEGFDCHVPVWEEIKSDMDLEGWISRKIDGEWLHFCCLNCYEEFLRDNKKKPVALKTKQKDSVIEKGERK